MLCAGVKGLCLHRPGNWLMRQLNDESKLVYKVGFIREKGKATARACSRAQKPVAHCSGEGWGFYGRFNSGLGGFFSLAMDLQAFSGELVWFAPLLGDRKQSWEHFAHQPCGRSIRPCIFSLGC
jgi:hypothetical protein